MFYCEAWTGLAHEWSLSFVTSRYVLAFWYYLEIIPDASSVVFVMNNPSKHTFYIYLFTCEICSKVTITTERRHGCHSGVFVNLNIFLPLFLLLTLSKYIYLQERKHKRNYLGITGN